MKFLADEHIDISAVEALRQISIDIISVQELEMRGFSDVDILTYANKNERAIVTRDADFLELHAKGAEHFGIVFLTKILQAGAIGGAIAVPKIVNYVKSVIKRKREN